MNDAHPESPTATAYWVTDLLGVVRHSNDLDRAAKLAQSNKQILERLYASAARETAEGTLFDTSVSRFDFLIGARR